MLNLHLAHVTHHVTHHLARHYHHEALVTWLTDSVHQQSDELLKVAVLAAVVRQEVTGLMAIVLGLLALLATLTAAAKLVERHRASVALKRRLARTPADEQWDAEFSKALARYGHLYHEDSLQ